METFTINSLECNPTPLGVNTNLNMGLVALTKHQCWLDVGRYFEEAKRTPYIQMSIMKIYKNILVCVKEIFVRNVRRTKLKEKTRIWKLHTSQ